MKPGLQVYSVRNQLNEDFEGTMEQLAKIGYKHLEGYGLGTDGIFLDKITPAHYSKVIKDLGMELKATHCSFTMHDKAQKMIDAAGETGVEYLIIPYTPDEVRTTADEWKGIAENYNKIGELCNKAGMKFGYHNHDFELIELDGIIPEELLIENTETDLVHFEADLFWVTKGGYDPLKLIEKYPGRIQLFHVKDATPDLEGTTVGEGIIDFEKLFNAAKADVLEYYFIEDEREDDPFKNITADLEYMGKQSFAK